MERSPTDVVVKLKKVLLAARPDCRHVHMADHARRQRRSARRERASACASHRVSEEECDEWQRKTVLNDRYYTNPLCTSSSTESTRDIQSTDGVNAIAGHAGGLCGM
jgi:hypothetical protein